MSGHSVFGSTRTMWRFFGTIFFLPPDTAKRCREDHSTAFGFQNVSDTVF